MYSIVNNHQLYYQKLGKGPSLLILHGWGQDLSSFWQISDLLKGSFTLWLIDLPGFGRSSAPGDNWQVQDYTSLIASFIKKEKIPRPAVLGHSLGGRIAIKLAARDPKIISKLILEDSAGLRPKTGAKGAALYFSAKIFKTILPNWFNLKEQVRHKLYRAIGSDYNRTGEMKQVFLNLINEDLTGDLKKITTPTLVIWGENDRTVPLLEGKKIYRLISNANLEVIEGAGHFPHLDNPQLFSHYVKEFV